MQTWVVPAAGVGQLAGGAAVNDELRLYAPITAFTVSLMRASVWQPEPLADGVSASPEQTPAGPPNGLSTATWLRTAWRAAWRAASATVDVTQSTRNRSIEMASRKKRRGKTRANSTSACPRLRSSVRLRIQYSTRCDDVTRSGYEPPVSGHRTGVMTDICLVIVAVMESEPGSAGPRPLPVAFVMATPLRQWKVTAIVAPARTVPAGVPSFELSSAAWLAMVTIWPPDGGTAVVTVTASGPPLVAAHTPLAVAC